jgi:hypothetical protein
MLDLPLVFEEFSARELRAEAVRLLHSAWLNGELVNAPKMESRKRKAASKCGNWDGDGTFIIDPDNFMEISD